MDTINATVRLRESVSGIMYSADNRTYDGEISVNDCVFRYNLNFAVPIDRLDELVREDPECALQQINLNITDKEGHLLEGESRDYFFGLVVPLAIDHYSRDSVLPQFLEHARSQGHSEVERTYTLTRTPQLENILGRR